MQNSAPPNNFDYSDLDLTPMLGIKPDAYDAFKHCIKFDNEGEGTLKPLGKSFLFEFINETIGGKFVEKNAGSIILTNQDLDTQGKFARWANVIAIGDLVKDFKEGDMVLIEALQWTIEYRFNGRSYWKSDETKVMAIGLDESVTNTYNPNSDGNVLKRVTLSAEEVAEIKKDPNRPFYPEELSGFTSSYLAGSVTDSLSTYTVSRKSDFEAILQEQYDPEQIEDIRKSGYTAKQIIKGQYDPEAFNPGYSKDEVAIMNEARAQEEEDLAVYRSILSDGIKGV